MRLYKNFLDKYGFPKKNYDFSKIENIFSNRIFFFGKFRRRFDLCFNLTDFKIIKSFYQDQYLENFYLDNIRKFVFINFNLRLLGKFFFLFFPKKNIFLKKNELILFGPYSHSYSHALHEFFVRLVEIQKKKKFMTVYLPLNLKRFLRSKIYKKIFSDLNFKYYSTEKNYIFHNCNYVSQTHNRWIYKKGKKTVPSEFKRLINIFTDKVKKQVPDNYKYKYIIVSRSNAVKRKLLNEAMLFNRLKKYGFKMVFFEKESLKKQIEISKNCLIMIGYHGAGLTNSFFMQKNTHLIEIYNKLYSHEHPEFFAKSVGVKFKKFECIKNYQDLNGECNVDEIEKYIVSNLL